MRPSIKLSLQMQNLAQTIENAFIAASGERVHFVLIALTSDHVQQYVSNTNRADGKVMMDDLLEQWRNNSAAIPAHENPDLLKED